MQQNQGSRAVKAAKLSEQHDRAIRNAYKTSRQDKGLTQADVAGRLGWSTSVVSNFEQGRSKLSPGEFVVMCRHGTDLEPESVFKRGLQWFIAP